MKFCLLNRPYNGTRNSDLTPCCSHDFVVTVIVKTEDLVGVGDTERILSARVYHFYLWGLSFQTNSDKVVKEKKILYVN